MDKATPIYRTLLDQLPFDLQVYEKSTGTIKGLTLQHLLVDPLKHYKPLLHSPEKLIEPILEGGLIPMIELTKLAFPMEAPEGFFDDAVLSVSEGCVHIHAKIQFSYNIENGYFLIFVSSMPLEVQNYTKLYDKLDEWHFNRRCILKEDYIEISE